MKPIPTLLALLLLTGGASFATAQEPPKAPEEQVRRPDEPPPPPSRGPDRDRDGRDGKRGGGPERGPHGPEHRMRGEQEMKPAAYLGIMTRAPGPELVAQAGLKEGFGLLIQEVMQDSPASKAGLKQHDLLHLFEDQKLVNVEQLSALVRAAGKDGEVKLTVRRAGQDVTVTVKIEEKLMPVERRHGGPHGGFPDFRSFGHQMHEWGDDFRDRMDRFNQSMRDYQEQLQDWMRGPKDKPLPPPPRFEGERRDGSSGGRPAPPRGGDRDGRYEVREEKRTEERVVTRRDEAGEYSLRSGGEGAVFIVRPKDGGEQRYEVNNQEQRETVPAEYKAKLEELEKMSRDLPKRPDSGREPDGPPPEKKDSI